MARIGYFDKKDVEITDIYFDEALELDAANLLKLDSDRLLAGFRETAGYIAGMNETDVKAFMKGKERYPGQWENGLIGGHTLGHYMSAVAQGVVNPGLSDEVQKALKERLAEMTDALAECQNMTLGTEYEGYLFGAELNGNIDNIDFQFDNVEKNLANIMTQAWVPWYTMHKILAGLVDTYVLTDNKKALQTANALAIWVANRVNRWDETTQQTVLGIEYGGMNDVLYELYKVTDAEDREKEEILKAAHQFDEISLFERVKKGERNCLQNIHANTTIPKFLGALCRYEVLPEEETYLEYAKAFWNFVTERQSYVTGGNSEDEHFRGDNSQNANRDNVNNETCNTYNMLKLSRRLFVITGEKKYADYYENTLINAIMASQNHDNGLTMYFQPMASGYHKVFGSLDSSFWCCTGSGMENFTKLQDSIYFQRDNEVIVNLYLASILRGEGYTLEQEGDLSVSDTMSFHVQTSEPSSLSLKLRLPDWVKDEKAHVKFGGEEYACEQENGYLVIPQEKLQGDTVFTLQLPMEIRVFNLPDSENTYAFKYGPYVLSAKLGTDKQALTGHGVGLSVPSRKAVKNDNIRITGGVKSVEEYMADINDNLVKQEGMNFKLKNTNFDYTFTTHYNQYRESYGIYWTYSMDEDGISSEAFISQKAQERMEQETVDHVLQIARGQYESGYVEEGDSVASTTDLTRFANPGGSFSYTMKVDAKVDNYLLVTRLLEERERPLTLKIAGKELSGAEENVTLSLADKEKFYQVMYRIPAELIDGAEKVTISFTGTTGMATEQSARICQSLVTLREFASDNDITGLWCGDRKIEEKDGVYNPVIAYTEAPVLKIELADTRGYVTINGNAVDTANTICIGKELNSDEELTLVVYAQNFKPVKTYTLRITRDYTGLAEALKKDLVKTTAVKVTKEELLTAVQPMAVQPAAEPCCQCVPGVVGKGLHLDGTFGLQLLEKASELGDSYTISFWMKPEKLGGCYDPVIMAGRFEEEAPRWLNLTFEGKLWSCNRGWITAEPANCFEKGVWQHVAIVVDGTKPGTVEETVCSRLYLNGKELVTGNVAEKIMSQEGSSLYFGVNPWDAYYQGDLSELFVLRRALTGIEVKALAEKFVTSVECF
jgi:DUF1680 family protein